MLFWNFWSRELLWSFLVCISTNIYTFLNWSHTKCNKSSLFTKTFHITILANMKFILYRNNSKTQSSHLKTKSAFLFSFTRPTEQRCSTNETNWCENDSSLGISESNCVLHSKVSWKSPQLTLVHDWSISANCIFKYVIIPITSPM